jgi:hypothetical protein
MSSPSRDPGSTMTEDWRVQEDVAEEAETVVLEIDVFL